MVGRECDFAAWIVRNMGFSKCLIYRTWYVFLSLFLYFTTEGFLIKLNHSRMFVDAFNTLSITNLWECNIRIHRGESVRAPALLSRGVSIGLRRHCRRFV